MALWLNKKDFDKIVRHARKHLPLEACGLLGGRIDDEKGPMVEKVYLLPNTDDSRTHFSIAQSDQLKAIKDMRSLGLVPLGNFHSHPETPARPSDEDISMARDPKAIYLILSLAKKKPVLKAFMIESTYRLVREEEILIFSTLF
jgi:proteasome lid subunit RPN8/RPN11